MKHHPIIGTITLVILVGGIALFAATRTATAPTTGAEASFLPATGPFTEHLAYADIAANYPTTTPLAARANEAALESMRNWVASTITTFKTDSGVASITPETAQQLGLSSDRKYTLQIVYLVASSAHTVSYIFTTYEDTGGAHGNTFFTTFTFDTTTGARLVIGDLFVPNSHYLETLSSDSRAYLEKNLGDMASQNMIEDGTKPEDTSFQNFFFDNADLILLFPPYQVAPFAAGAQTVRIPASDLSGVLKTAYP